MLLARCGFCQNIIRRISEICRTTKSPLLAIALRDALARLSAALDDPPYNYAIDSAAKGSLGMPALHWHLRILPQVTVPAGFELGSGLAINPSLPEKDAKLLRSFRPVFQDFNGDHRR